LHNRVEHCLQSRLNNALWYRVYVQKLENPQLGGLASTCYTTLLFFRNA
jgi:hypothetical protein